mmetsp:Transcript_5043/g.10611  ORF Transcript_5043/g.10611 Transcript_5043/m.10611 type:complete len:617 (-) Transcript_5043:37-1887(-)
MSRRRNAAAADSGSKTSEIVSLISSLDDQSAPHPRNRSRRPSLKKDSGHGDSHKEERRPLVRLLTHDDDDNKSVMTGMSAMTSMTALTSTTAMTATPIIAAISKHTGLPRKAAYVIMSVILVSFLIWREGYRIRVNVSSSTLLNFNIQDIPVPKNADEYNKPHLLDAAWPGHDNVNFETLVQPSEIDLMLQRRLPEIEEGHECDDILLYMPNQLQNDDDDVNVDGVAGQLNSYLMAAMLATYTSKAMVVLESKEDVVPGGSQFGCPSNPFSEAGKSSSSGRFNVKEDIPKGLSRLIQHSEWLSRGCSVPCQNNHDYEKWSNVRKKNGKSKFVQHTTCRNDSGWESRVLVVDGADVQRLFENNFKGKMLHRPSPTAYNWALRLGAKKYEAQTFADLEDEEDIWDFVSALLARSDVLRFQPWIAKDARNFIRLSQLPMQVDYDAFHVRRDGSIQGYEEEAGVEVIPFQEYLKTWERHDCSDKARIIYIASDDPGQIKEEISKYPVGDAGNLILPGVDECHGLRFYLREDSTSTEFMKKGSTSDCSIQYRRTISSVADLIILSKSSTFIIGEFGSGFGRLVRTFRAALNDFPGREEEGPVLVRDTRVVWGKPHPGPPGM